MTVGYGGMIEGNVGDPGLGKVPTDLEIASWPRDEDVADDDSDQEPKIELPRIGVPVDQTE